MKVLGMPVASVIDILQLGFSGVAFLFLLMSFKLLREEQTREGFPRQNMLRAIKQFSYLTLIFAILIWIANAYEYQFSKKTHTNTRYEVVNKCQKAVLRAKTAITKPEKYDKKKLIELINATALRCDSN